MLSSGMKCYHLGGECYHLGGECYHLGWECYHLGLHDIIWDEIVFIRWVAVIIWEEDFIIWGVDVII